MSPRRRVGDEDDEWRERTPHELDREEMEHLANQAPALIIGWGNKSISVKGAAAVGFIMYAALVVAVIYTGSRIEQAVSKDHQEIRRGQDRMACSVLMTMEERVKFREEYKPGAWHRWCPWMGEE